MTFEEAWDVVRTTPDDGELMAAVRRFGLEVMGEAYWAAKEGLKAREAVRARIEALR